MARAANRHYRVAKKNAAMNPSKAVVIPKSRKKLIICLAASFAMLVFLKGLIIGLLISRKRG